LRFTRTLGFSAPHAFTNVAIRKTASLALRRHLSVFHPCSPFRSKIPVDSRTLGQTPRLSFLALQRASAEKTLFFASLSGGVWKVLPYSPEVPSSGFGYPHDGVSTFQPWESFSTPNALGLRPTELCSFVMIDVLFRKRLSAPALSYKTSRLHIGAPAVCSHNESRVSSCFPVV
jgi:hypothetical protein